MDIIKSHNKISRLVNPEDAGRVMEEAEKIYKLLNKPRGFYLRFYAIAHAQCEEKDPLRFFVLNDEVDLFKDVDRWESLVVVNPVIIRNTETKVEGEEACASFPENPIIKVSRWHKIEVSFNFLKVNSEDEPFLSERKELNLSGKEARVFQHEIDHLNGKNIYEF